jgi:hypothetical protein
VSDDGHTFARYGINPAGQGEGWIARVDILPVPEPGTAALLGAGLALVALGRRGSAA